jgi:hypothetical protein
MVGIANKKKQYKTAKNGKALSRLNSIPKGIIDYVLLWN